ncbi:hypothetical protein B0J11DRAFT_324917 [Dendryphion nanum]|uniref:Exonuclease domain-containing protein n=1 Tax=Dendryphion nanum TaxID=256645 RepID=A0A9P9IKK2_9PLEO|nr:hypothetical protein B0J11DRAFT_324917 [Dendryphion nanum]
MTKRKRGSSEPPESVQDGSASNLSAVKGDATNDSNLRSSEREADEGWTVVAPKKKRVEYRKLSPPRTQQATEGSFVESKGDTANSPIEASEHQLPERKQQEEYHANPFALPESNGRRNDVPVNPFSTSTAEKKDEKNGSSHRDRERIERKNERKHERRIEKSYPAIEHSNHARLQNHIKITDLQTLILYILADGNAPQWVSIKNRADIRRVVVVMVPGLELAMFNGKIPLEASSSSATTNTNDVIKDGSMDTSTDAAEPKPNRLSISPDDYHPASLNPKRLPAALKPLAEIFPHVWPIMGIAEKRGNQYSRVHSPIHTMLTSQVPKTSDQRKLKKSSSHKGPLPQNTKHWENRRTRITEYIVNVIDQQESEYVVHPAWFSTPEAKEAAEQRRKAAGQSIEHGWVDTNVASLEEGDIPEEEIEKGSATAGRKVLTVDCEMCITDDDRLTLTRVSLIDWNGDSVLERLVMPDIPIKDYNTQYSGITAAMLENVTTRLQDVQKELLEILTPRTILVGHSLNSDLNALKLTHPFLVDSALLYPHPRGPPYKQALRWLCQKYLSRQIQKGSNGHDSVEDARACLDLVKQKCERGPLWGTGDTNAESIFKRLGRTNRPKSSNAVRAGAVIDWGEPSRGHGGQAQVAIGCKSDDEVIAGMQLALEGHALNKEGVTEKVDLVWARLRELELVRGWWDDAKTADVQEIRKAALKRLNSEDDANITGQALGAAVAGTVKNITKIWESLPPCTAFIVYGGTGDPREMRRLQGMHKTYQKEYQTKNWDNLSVKWTDTEVQALSRACQRAREGVGFMVVK